MFVLRPGRRPRPLWGLRRGTPGTQAPRAPALAPQVAERRAVRRWVWGRGGGGRRPRRDVSAVWRRRLRITMNDLSFGLGAPASREGRPGLDSGGLGGKGLARHRPLSLCLESRRSAEAPTPAHPHRVQLQPLRLRHKPLPHTPLRPSVDPLPGGHRAEQGRRRPGLGCLQRRNGLRAPAPGQAEGSWGVQSSWEYPAPQGQPLDNPPVFPGSADSHRPQGPRTAGCDLRPLLSIHSLPPGSGQARGTLASGGLPGVTCEAPGFAG